MKVWGNSINAGFPDLFCGTFWVEIKAPGKKLRPTQVEWFETFVPQGTRAYVCDDPRKLWDIVGEKHGSAPSNWKDFAPRVSHREKMAAAMNGWAILPGTAWP